MFRNPFRKPDTSGFTREHKKNFDRYRDLWLAGNEQDDTSAATAFLAEINWTEDYAHTVMDHFYPKRVYTGAEVSAAREALALHQAGQKQESEALLREYRLTVDDILPCVDQFYEQFDLDDEEDEAVSSAAAGIPA